MDFKRKGREAKPFESIYDSFRLLTDGQLVKYLEIMRKHQFHVPSGILEILKERNMKVSDDDKTDPSSEI